MFERSPIPAATLVIVRDRTGAPPELLMVERASTMVFAAGMMVFPGGRIDPGDMDLGNQLNEQAGSAIVAAVRETLEETAVPVSLHPLPSPELALELQRALLAGAPLGDLLTEHRLTLDPTAITHFTRWLPPLDAPRRFDTWFFLAAAPPGEWIPNVGEEENRSAEWLTAADALERDRTGTAGLIFPTRCNLVRLAQHDNFAAMLADVSAYPPTTISPWIEERDGGRWLTINDGVGYPITAELLASARRG
ncbi:MAG: NUDIX domain-containing protein [Sphingomicrobium sp.]